MPSTLDASALELAEAVSNGFKLQKFTGEMALFEEAKGNSVGGLEWGP